MGVGDDVYRRHSRKTREISARGPRAGEQQHRRRRESPVKRFARSPWPWIVVAVLLILFALQYIASPGGDDEITTRQMRSYINAGQVKDITLVDGGDQTIKATLKPEVRASGSEVTAHWLDGTQSQISDEIQKQIDQGNMEADSADVK